MTTQSTLASSVFCLLCCFVGGGMCERSTTFPLFVPLCSLLLHHFKQRYVMDDHNPWVTLTHRLRHFPHTITPLFHPSLHNIVHLSPDRARLNYGQLGRHVTGYHYEYHCMCFEMWTQRTRGDTGRRFRVGERYRTSSLLLSAQPKAAVAFA